MKITVPLLPPSVNHYVKHAVIAGRLRSYQTAEAKAFKAAVAMLAAGRSISPSTASQRRKVAYRVTVTVTLGPKQSLDASNSIKVAEDALVQCGVIHSDARVAEVIGRVIWNKRAEGPRTDITVEVIA